MIYSRKSYRPRENMVGATEYVTDSTLPVGTIRNKLVVGVTDKPSTDNAEIVPPPIDTACGAPELFV
jgi:hypothetical protein